MMDGEGAEEFARENGTELVDQKYFFTQERWDALQKIKAAEKHRSGAAGKAGIITDQDRHGTVGAVALDANGNLAAATSTGGTTNKRPGRVGDTPVIGAGTCPATGRRCRRASRTIASYVSRESPSCTFTKSAPPRFASCTAFRASAALI